VSRRGRRKAGNPPDQAPAPPGPRERAPSGEPDLRDERRTREKDMPRGDRGSPERRSRDWAPRLLAQAAFLAAIVGVATLVAELAGAANLGVALGIGQIAFAVALVALLLWR
jgi:hypothetical protein